MDIHDHFIRSIMADKQVARDYFVRFLPPSVVQRLDFQTLEQSPESYISRELSKTMSDIVFTCQHTEKEEQIKIGLLVEHKSYIDKHTPIQMGSYIFSGWLKQIKNKEKPSLIIPILLYHGKEKWGYSTLSDLFEHLDEEMKAYLPNFDYVYNNLGALTDAEVEALNNQFLVASLLTLKHSFDKIWLETNASSLLLRLEGVDGNLQTGFIVYLFRRSGLKPHRIKSLIQSLPATLKETVMSTADMLIQEGKKQGLEEGKAEVVTNLLINTDFDCTQIAALANVSVEFVKNIQNTVLK